MYYISKIKNYCKSTYNYYFPENQYDIPTQPRTPLLPEVSCDTLSKNIPNINSLSSSSTEDTFPYTVNILDDHPIQSSPSLLTDNNKISTSKYTPLNCIPKIIIEQFSKTANVYFLIIAIFQTVKEISNSNGKPVILFPLFIVISVNGVKNFYEDWKRRKSDEEENSKQCCILNHSTGKFEMKTWESIVIGDIIKISNNEFIPADCVIVSSSEQNGVCYIETKSIDGETNLKYKKANTNINAYYINNNNSNDSDISDEERLMKFNGCKIKTQVPNEHIYEFSGKIVFNTKHNSLNNNHNGNNNNGSSMNTNVFNKKNISNKHNNNNNTFFSNISTPHSQSNTIPYFTFNITQPKEKENFAFIESESFLLRGCSLKQTKYIYAIVIYVGHNTKIMQNSPKSRNKTSRVETIMNHQIMLVFLLQVIISLISSFISLIQLNNNINGLNYIFVSKQNINSYNITYLIVRAGTWIILLNNIVPISLLVTLEMVKYIQGMFISWDIEMYDTQQRTPTKVQTSTLNEELGQVKFIFTDKTGTLTKNNMEFKAMAIGSFVYGIDDDYDNNHKLLLNDPYGFITNFNFASKTFTQHLTNKTHPNYTYIHLFLTCLSLCHSVILDQNTQKQIIYQSSSPDETAMVNCARYFNYIFNGRDIYNNIYIKTKSGEQYTYNILHVLEYTSERKRMSVIVKTVSDGKIKVFTKGADNVISTRLASSNGKTHLNTVDKNLLRFAKKGLRTLMIAYRELNENVYNKFEEVYKSAMNHPLEKEMLLNKAADLIEKDLILLGATAIEDQLQDNIDEVLQNFIDTGIKVWVLTGDKMDTAKSIAFSCKLINHNFFIFEFPENSTCETINEHLKEFSKEFYLSEGEQKRFAIVVSHNELLKILNNKTLSDLFYSLAIHCNSVLCCRVTPKQKAQMVQLVKNHQPNITTLAIGDGANDVNMITAANIGIGIIGVEGRQAARASDYAISQFQYLKRLLFVHGRESYRKNSFIVCYNFYKNVLFVIPHFWFGFVSFFSGQSLYDPWLYQIFNILFASFPIIWFGIYDKEVSYDTLMKDNRYYMQGIVDKLFHSLRFWKWIAYGILQGSFIYLYSFYANNNAVNQSGHVSGLGGAGSIAYSGVVVIVNMKILLTTCTHSYISIGLFFFSTAAYYFILYIMSGFPNLYNFNNFTMIVHGADFYLSTICLVMICVIIDLGTGTFLRIYGWVADPLRLRPETFDIKIQFEQMREMELIKEDYNDNDKDDINNKYKGSAFAKQEKKNISIIQ